MSLIDWNDSLSVGVEEIDSQHKIWIQTLNDLHVALSKSSSEDLIDATKKAINAMWVYTCFHFKAEEGYMASIMYPDLPGHRVLHDSFSLDVLQIYNDAKDGKQVLSSEVMKMLTTWLQEHIMQEDKKIGLYIASQHSN